MSEELPQDPFANAEMLPMAKTAYGMFCSFMAAGFSETQAMQITISMVNTMLANALRAEKKSAT